MIGIQEAIETGRSKDIERAMRELERMQSAVRAARKMMMSGRCSLDTHMRLMDYCQSTARKILVLRLELDV